MSFFVGDQDGLELLDIIPDDTRGFKPLLGSSQDVATSFLWNVLPNDYVDLPSEDKKVFESLWKAMAQVSSEILLEALHLDQSSSLLDFPLNFPRKWLPLELERDERVTLSNPALLFSRAEDVSEDEEDSVVLRAGHQDSLPYLGFRLGAPHTGAETFRAEARLSLERIPLKETWTWFGYGRRDRGRLVDGVFTAVSTLGRLAAVEVSRSQVRWQLCEDVLGTLVEGRTYSVSLWLEGETEDKAPWMISRIRDSETGEFVFRSTELLSPFQANEVLLCGVDNRLDVASPHEDLLSEASPLRVRVSEIKYLDVSVPPDVTWIPVLQPRVSDDLDSWVAGEDYLLSKTSQGTTVRFFTQPPAVLWAEYASLDSGWLQKLFSPLVGAALSAAGDDSERTRNRIAALLYGLVKGPSQSALSTALAGIAGVPVALARGVVTRIKADADSPFVEVREFDRDRRYQFPALLRPRVAVGDVVEKMDPLTEYPQALDWKMGRRFLDRVAVNQEAEKYKAIVVEIPYGSLGAFAEDEGPRDFPNLVTEYFQKALPLWASTLSLFFVLIGRLEDDLALEERIGYQGLLHLRDALTLERDPRYNDGRGFVYDGPDGLLYDEADRILDDRLVLLVYNHSDPR